MIGAIAVKQHKRSAFWAILGSFILAGLLVVGTHYALQFARLQDVKFKTHDAARGWAEHLQMHTPNLDQIFEIGQATPEQLPAIEMAETYGGVQGYSLFDVNGELVLSRGPAPNGISIDDRSALARDTARTGVMQTTFLTSQIGTGSTDIDAITRIPIADADGNIIGVAELCTHQADPLASITNVTSLVILGVPFLSAFAFLVPMLIMIRFRRRATAREVELANLARQDELTGLMNRSGIATKVRPIFAERRDPGEQIGILLVDLDNFKSINDIFGAPIADAFLCQTAERLLEIVGNSGFVGRMNGDEFIIILPTITREALRRYGAQIQSIIAQPLPISGQTVMCSACIGMHLSPMGQSLERALHAVDLALNQAINNGQGQSVEYVDALDKVTNRHNQIESYLRRVGFEQAVEVYFQPFVDATSGAISGFEALARLRDDEGAIISPDEFIPVAESTGLIHELGIVVLSKAISAAKQWPEHIYVSVNLSPVQFQNSGLADEIIAKMREAGLAPDRLELELTESLLLTDEEGVSAMLDQLRSAGLSIAMDDFGTGYSSLGYLWKYDFDKIKIDRSFLLGHDFEEGRYFDIIETIILLGHKLGMSVTVEGVETRKQVDILTKMSCDQFQGYYFARPLTEAQATAVVSSLCEPLQKTG